MSKKWEKVFYTDTLKCEECGNKDLEYYFRNGRWLCRKCAKSIVEVE